MRFARFHIVLLAFVLTIVSASVAKGDGLDGDVGPVAAELGELGFDEWRLKLPGEYERPLTPDGDGGVRSTVSLPDGALVQVSRRRETMRPDRGEFQAGRLAMEVKMVSGSDQPVRCNLFVKDKDGYWFQSREDFRVEPNQWRNLTVPLPTDANGLRPVGHRGAWDSQFATGAHTVGVSLYGGETRDVRVFCRPPRFEGRRNEGAKPLRVVDWRMPTKAKVYEMVVATFDLTREYFNPFNPEEIRVDAEVMGPDGNVQRWPAFQTRGWTRKIRHNMEMLEPVGAAHWEWRYTPQRVGGHKIRLVVEDAAAAAREPDAEMESDDDSDDAEESPAPKAEEVDDDDGGREARSDQAAAESVVAAAEDGKSESVEKPVGSAGDVEDAETAAPSDETLSLEGVERLVTPWETLRVEPSAETGFVRVCAEDTRYFELTTGEFYFPIGFNLHTIRDERGEIRLKTGYVPNRGTFAYEEYFEAMGRHGVNATEIWMAAWSVALEWTSAHRGYRGLGRYNLANAWKLDHILRSAKANGVYVQLILDNHGKLATKVDPEWDLSPYNLDNPFAVADGACLENTREFFTSEKARRFYRRRNRYVAARWGAFTNIFGIELWSEIDLVTGHKAAYKAGESVDWHRAEATYLKRLDQGGHLVTTHTCADYQNTLEHRELFDLSEIDYVAGDGYRNPKISIVEHMRRHERALKDFDKPIMITEYGGTAHACAVDILLADLHGGVWSSFFKGQGGTPFLWWHDFIHSNNHYPHFKGFAAYMRDIDPRGKNFVTGETPVFGEPFPADGEQEFRPTGSINGKPLHPLAPAWKLMALAKRPPLIYSVDNLVFELEALADHVNSTLGCLTIGDADERYGWVFVKDAMRRFPVDCLMKIAASRSEQRVALNGLRPKTDYAVSFHDTMTGETLDERIVRCEAGRLGFALPPFVNDVAFKVRRIPLATEKPESADQAACDAPSGMSPGDPE